MPRTAWRSRNSGYTNGLSVRRSYALTAPPVRCAFRHGDLLDAAHIQEDGAGGRPVVTNGLTLCKMHHAAYDRQILGITADYEVRVNAAVLREVDGPMLRHGIQEFHGKQLMVLPDRRTERPDRLLLEERFQTFLDAS